jgi:DNA-binding response OmpR family regulator
VERPPSLFLIDGTLVEPGIVDLVRTVRSNDSLSETKVLLTGRNIEAAGIRAVAPGVVNDFLAKPFTRRELLATVRANLRGSARLEARKKLKVGTLEIDPSAMALKVAGSEVPTTALQFLLLYHLASQAPEVFTRNELIRSVWPYTSHASPRAVDVCINRLREPVESNPANPVYLKTVPGVGYHFEYTSTRRISD